MRVSHPILLVLRTNGGEVPTYIDIPLEGTDIHPVGFFASLPQGRLYRCALISCGTGALAPEVRERLKTWVDSVVENHLVAGGRAVWLP